MSESSYGQTGTPRVFIDLIQWAKLQGRVRSYSKNASHFDYDPTTTNIDTSFTSSNSWSSYVYFDNQKYRENLQFRHLLQSFNYAGMLGHSLAETPNAHNIGTFHIGFSGRGANHENAVVTGNNYDNKIHASGEFGKNIGCSLYTFDGFNIAYGQWEDAWEEMRVVVGTDWADPSVDFVKFGTITAGRYFDFPHNVDLKLNKTFDFDQVQTKRTYGGTDLTQINYKRQLWNGLPPWTHIKLDHHEDYATAIRDENYKDVAFQGKRSWDLSLSYVSKEEMFPRNYSNSMIGYYGNSDEELGSNLIDNGTFDSTSNWDADTGWTITGGVASCDGSQSSGIYLQYYQNLIEIGKTYKVQFDVTSTAGEVEFEFGGNGNTIEAIPSTSDTKITKRYYIENTGTSQTFKFKANSSFVGEIDNVKVQELITSGTTFWDQSSGVHTENIIGSLMTFTHGGTIPFIFQEDNTINRNFAMCIIDQRSINVTRVAPELYNIKLKIREI